MDTSESYENLFWVKIADKISAMFAYWDTDLVCRFANTAYLDWFGKSKDEMINKMTLKELLGPIFELNQPYITEALKGNVQTFEREIPIPSGGVRYSLAHYYPDIENGVVKGFFVHVVDVSPLKILEKQLIASNEKITNQNRRLLNFANMVSHNLASHVTNLTLSLEVFNMLKSKKEKDEMFEHLRQISAGFSSTIIDLNQIVKLQNQEEVEVEPVHVNEYIQKTLLMLQYQVTSQKINILNKLDENVKVLSNPAYMESILLNLLTNAIKYRHPDRDAIIEISNSFEGNRTVISIKDNGLGIDLNKYGSSLFGMYKTFHGNKDAQGIGLFITKYQIEKMGGEIKVESEVNIGSTFNIYFDPVL